MNRRKPVPEPIIVPLLPAPKQTTAVYQPQPQQSVELRSLRVEEFLQARSLTPKSQKAYRQDLQHFLNWTDKDWADITPHRITAFKAYLLRQDLNSGQRVLSDATVRRILGTLKSFYRWMTHCRYLTLDPTAEVQLPKLSQPEAQNLTDTEVAQIYEAVALSSLPQRNIALISVLLHGLQAEEVSGLDIEDYDGKRLRIREARTTRQEFVPLTVQGKTDLEQYLQWRQERGDLLLPQSPLFISHSRRNDRQRLGYDGIRKLIKQLAQQTGIDFQSYQLRHTFATKLLSQGMNPCHVMTLTRHRSLQNLRRYTPTADQAAAEAAFDEMMEGLGTSCFKSHTEGTEHQGFQVERQD